MIYKIPISKMSCKYEPTARFCFVVRGCRRRVDVWREEVVIRSAQDIILLIIRRDRTLMILSNGASQT